MIAEYVSIEKQYLLDAQKYIDRANNYLNEGKFSHAAGCMAKACKKFYLWDPSPFARVPSLLSLHPRKVPPMAQPKPAPDWTDNAADTSQVNPGTKPDASKPAAPHGNPDAIEHGMIKGAGPASAEGGRDEGQVAAPTVSLYPTSQPQGEASAEIGEHRIIDDVNFALFKSSVPTATQMDLNYPFDEMDIGTGMFVPVEQGGTTDALMSKLYKQVDQFRKQYSEVEHDENGDDVMEDVAINVKMRNEDGTVKLDGDKPRLTIKSGFRPKLIGPNFAVKAVVKGDEIGDGDEAEADGALVIRLG